MKLLVAEDEPKTGQYLRQGLAEAGFAVELAGDGVSGEQLALSGEHDLLILDVMLPGLSGFVAEMTVFVGSFEHPDVFHRACTVIATVSIVVTAVYILRVVGKILYGTCRNPEHLKLTDATWDERFAVICLIVCVAGLGLAPWWEIGRAHV